MLISTYLDKLDIKYNVHNEVEVDSLGLADYNNGDRVVTFIENENYVGSVTSNVKLIITNESVYKKIHSDVGVVIVKNARDTFFRLHNLLTKEKDYNSNNLRTKIGLNCDISPLAVIAKNNVIIGDNVKIEEFVVIRENTRIGDNSIIRAGSRIGGEGFEFKKNDTEVMAVKHVGWVEIGKNVEIQYNTCIDKAIYPWDKTFVGDDVKIDNLVHIAHGCKIGNRTMIVANSGIGGRTVIENDSWIGFGATIRNGLHVGSRSRANMGAVVTKSIPSGEAVSGNFAINHHDFIEKMKTFRRLR